MARPAEAKLTDIQKMGDVNRLIEDVVRLDKIIDDYKDEPGSLIMTLRKIQDLFGCVPVSALRRLSQKSQIPLSELIGIVSFYHFFSMVPKGEHTIKTCMGTSCYVRGGEKIMNLLRKELKLEPGGTTEDGKFSLEMVRCLGCCGLSPVMSVDDTVYTRVNRAKILEVTKKYA